LTVSNSVFESLPGAVGTPPEHYGNPLAEQRALAAGEAIVYLGHRAVITVTGPDRLRWLDSLTSQSLAGLQPGSSAETLQLDPTGRVEFVIRVVDDGETAWLLVDEAPDLLAWLLKMRFMLQVEIADVSDRYQTIGSLGLPVSNAVVTWNDPWSDVQPGGHQYSARTNYEWNYSESLVENLEPQPAAGTLALEALRIAAWRPRFATEVDDRSIPHELDWLRSAVHLSKGCYRGQETVAKVHNLGHPPRRLVMLHLDGATPAPGTPVKLVDAEVGFITSAAMHYELGPIALAVVKRSVDPAADLVVTVDGEAVAAAQEVIVPPSAGASLEVPRLPRLGAVTRPS
jgi:hypothetical protein